MVRLFKLSKSTSSGILPPARLFLFHALKQRHRMGTMVKNTGLWGQCHLNYYRGMPVKVIAHPRTLPLLLSAYVCMQRANLICFMFPTLMLIKNEAKCLCTD